MIHNRGSFLLLRGAGRMLSNFTYSQASVRTPSHVRQFQKSGKAGIELMASQRPTIDPIYAQPAYYHSRQIQPLKVRLKAIKDDVRSVGRANTKLMNFIDLGIKFLENPSKGTSLKTEIQNIRSMNFSSSALLFKSKLMNAIDGQGATQEDVFGSIKTYLERISKKFDGDFGTYVCVQPAYLKI